MRKHKFVIFLIASAFLAVTLLPCFPKIAGAYGPYYFSRGFYAPFCGWVCDLSSDGYCDLFYGSYPTGTWCSSCSGDPCGGWIPNGCPPGQYYAMCTRPAYTCFFTSK